MYMYSVCVSDEFTSEYIYMYMYMQTNSHLCDFKCVALACVKYLQVALTCVHVGGHAIWHMAVLAGEYSVPLTSPVWYNYSNKQREMSYLKDLTFVILHVHVHVSANRLVLFC